MCGGVSDDFDFGDLVAMTIVDVFETDANGLLLSYCPTFDNRAVHKTPEMAQRLRKGVGQMRETMEVVANSPVGKSVNMVRGDRGYNAQLVGSTERFLFEYTLLFPYVSSQRVAHRRHSRPNLLGGWTVGED